MGASEVNWMKVNHRSLPTTAVQRLLMSIMLSRNDDVYINSSEIAAFDMDLW